MDINLIMTWLGSILAFFAGILAGIALGKWRRDRNVSPRGISASDGPGRLSRSWGDTILVDTATGSHFFASDYLKCHSRMDLFGELANGHFVHEAEWDRAKGNDNTRLEVTEVK